MAGGSVSLLTDSVLRTSPGAITLDAWNKLKTVNDFSLFHGMWTYDVPNRLWEEKSIAAGAYTPLTSTGTLATSVNSHLQVSSGAVANQGAALFSKRNPRYQPNRGHLYSTALWLPDATLDGRRKFGVFNSENGVYFELEGDGADWELYAVRYSNSVVQSRTPLKSFLPSGFDIEKGHVYDIQYQWRGLGNYKFYVDLTQVHIDDVLGSLSDLSMRMPALPCGFECVTDTTTPLLMNVGCVDITSEGGIPEGRQFTTISTGDALLDANSTGIAMLAIKIPRTANGFENTRDLVIEKITSWTRDEAATKLWLARDTTATNLDAATWLAVPDSFTEYLVGGVGSALNTAFQLDKANMSLQLVEWIDIEEKNIVEIPEPDIAPLYGTPGDIFVVEIQSFGGTDSNATTLYFTEEI